MKPMQSKLPGGNDLKESTRQHTLDTYLRKTLRSQTNNRINMKKEKKNTDIKKQSVEIVSANNP